jgi:hypothetical protein
MGLGFMITEHLAMTLHAILPDEDTAERCFFRFKGETQDTFQFLPRIFFYTNVPLNFSVVWVRYNHVIKKNKTPVEIREKFVLNPGDQVTYLNSGLFHKHVNAIEGNNFSFTSGGRIDPGMPIFTRDMKL